MTTLSATRRRRATHRQGGAQQQPGLYCLLVLLVSTVSGSLDASSSDSNSLLTTTTTTEAFDAKTTKDTPSRYLQDNDNANANGDFDELNALLADFSLALPDFEVETEVLWVDFKLRMSNVFCKNLYVGNMTAVYSMNGAENTVTIGTKVKPFELSCFGKFDYDYGWIGDGGDMQAHINQGNVDVDINLASTDYNTVPPKTASLGKCQAFMNIHDMDFNGGLTAAVLDAAERLVGNVMEDLLVDVLCTQMEQLIPRLDQQLLVAHDWIVAYQQPIPDDLADPLQYEDNFQPQSAAVDGVLLDFNNPWFQNATQQLNDKLGAVEEDPNSPTGTGTGTDLSMNILLRRHILDEDRALTMNVAERSEDGAPMQVVKTNMSGTDIVITLDAFRIFGLDTLQNFVPITAIGNYTLQTRLVWQELDVEVDLTLISTPQDDDQEHNTVKTRESFKVRFGLEQFDGIISVFIPFSLSGLEWVTLGSLLDTDYTLNCLLSLFRGMQFSGMYVSMGALDDPVLTGFISPGMDRVITTLLESGFAMYESPLLLAMPHIFEAEARTLINSLIDTMLNQTVQESCPAVQAPANSASLVDYRDLMLPPEQALAMGGQGTEPYGDLIHMLYGFLYNMTTQADDDANDGTLAINSNLIAPLTSALSGEAGTFVVDRQLYSLLLEEEDMPPAPIPTEWSAWYAGLVTRLELVLSDVKVQNLDTLVAPLLLMYPTAEDPIVLDNDLTLGSSTRPLRVGMKMLLAMEGNAAAALPSTNEIEFQFELDALQFAADLRLPINTTAFMSFPLRHVTNVNCWLATLQAAPLNEQGFVLDETALHGLAIENVLMSLASLGLATQCVSVSSSCDSPAMVSAIQTIHTLLEDNGLGVLVQRLPGLITTLAESNELQVILDRILYGAHQACPTSPHFVSPSAGDEAAVEERPRQSLTSSSYARVGIPKMTSQDIDTLLYTGLLVAWTAANFLAQNKILLPDVSSDPMAAEQSYSVPDGVRLVDFSALGNSTGLNNIGEVALEAGLDYLGSNFSDTGVLGIVDALSTYFDEDNIIPVEFEDDEGKFVLYQASDDDEDEDEDLVFYARELRVGGIDSFTRFDLLSPVLGSYTADNYIDMDFISLELDFSVGYESSDGSSSQLQDLSVRFAARDISVQAAFFAALDVDRLVALKTGSVLELSNVFPCVMSLVRDIQFPHTNITVAGSLEPLSVTGLYNDTSNAFASTVNALQSQFGASVLENVPKLLDSQLIKHVAGAAFTIWALSETCPPLPPPDPSVVHVDFRILLGPEESELYGDVPAVLKEYLDTDLGAAADDGDNNNSTESISFANINKVAIDPLTQEQSGQNGTLLFPEPLVNMTTADFIPVGINTTEFRLYNIRIDNLNTFHTPVLMAEPNQTSPFLLDNHFIVGTESLPLRVGMSVLLDLEGDGVLASRNEINVFVDFVRLDAFLVAFAKLRHNEFMNFPVGNIPNINCFFSLCDAPDLDEDGYRLLGEEPGLALDALTMAASSVHLGAECVSADSCTTQGLEYLPEVMETLASTGEVSSVLREAILDLAVEFAFSDMVQTIFDRMLSVAEKRCDFSDLVFDLDSGFPFPPIPALSTKSLEGLTFVSLYAMDAAFTLLAYIQSFKEFDSAVTNPLSEQEELDSSAEEDNGVRLLDWNALNDTIADWVASAIEEGREYLGGLTENDDGSIPELGINTLMRSSSFLEDDGSLLVDLSGLTFGGDDTSELMVRMNHVKIRGLDTFTVFDVFDAIGAQTLRNVMVLEKLGLQLELTVGSSDVSRRRLADDDEGSLTMTIDLALSQVNVALSVLLAIDQDLLGDLKLGQIMNLNQILQCFISTMHKAGVTEFGVSVGSIDSFTINGFQTPETVAASNSLNQVLLDEYGDLILESIGPFFGVTVRNLVNNFFEYYMVEDACHVMDTNTTGIMHIDFRDLFLSQADAVQFGGTGTTPYGELLHMVHDFINNELLDVDPETGETTINELMERITDDGTLSFPGELYNFTLEINLGGLQLDLGLYISDVYVSNVDTFGPPLFVLDPVSGQAHDLNSTATAGKDRPLRLGMRLFVEMLGSDGTTIRNDVELSMDFGEVSAFLTILLRVAEERLFSFPLEDVLNLDCWLATMPTPQLDSRGVRFGAAGEAPFSLRDLSGSIADFRMNVTCIDCTSPLVQSWADVLSTPEAVEDATLAANDILDFALGILGDKFLQLRLDRLVNDARKRCPHSPEYEGESIATEYDAFNVPETDDSTKFFLAVGLLGGLGVIITLSTMLAVKLIVRRRHRKWLHTRSREQVVLLWHHQKADQEWESYLNSATTSMFESPEIPRLVRLSVPVIILGNVAFFLSGHLSLGGSVHLEANVAGQTYEAGNFFDFSMAQSTIDIWNAGGIELALMILLFSGVWPYTKQLITLALWLLPPEKFSVSSRGSTFLWLDALAKWSMLDIFALILTLIGFRISVQSPSRAFLPDDFYSLDLLVIPKWGLYANMIAQLVSQISSHFIIHYHRLIVDTATKRAEELHSTKNKVGGVDIEKEDSSDFEGSLFGSDDQVVIAVPATSPDSTEKRLCDHAFTRPHRGEADLVVARSMAKPLVVAVSSCLVLFVLLGNSLPSFTLEVFGLVGLMVESGQGFRQAYDEYSVFTTAGRLFDQAAFTGSAADFIGLGSFSMLLLFTVLVVPLVQTGTLLYQWFHPMTRHHRNRVMILLEMLTAWEYASVYLVAVIVTSWQLGPISEFMINTYCASLTEFFAEWVYYGAIDVVDAQCFKVEIQVVSGSYLLATAAVLLALLNTFIVRASRQYLRETEVKVLTGPFQSQALGHGDMAQTMEEIQPVPVLFTDAFRWFLRREDMPLSLIGQGKTLTDQDASAATRDDEVAAAMMDSSDDNSPFPPFVVAGVQSWEETRADPGGENSLPPPMSPPRQRNSSSSNRRDYVAPRETTADVEEDEDDGPFHPAFPPAAATDAGDTAPVDGIATTATPVPFIFFDGDSQWTTSDDDPYSVSDTPTTNTTLIHNNNNNNSRGQDMQQSQPQHAERSI